MRPRLAVLLALLVVVLLVAAQQRWLPAASEPTASTVSAQVEPDRRLDFTGATTKAELEAILESAYRLPPDRRMTGALAQVANVVAPGRALSPVRAEWAIDRWALTVGGSPAGTLAALPSFAEGLALAEGWARSSGAAARLPSGAPDGIAAAFLRDAMPEQALAQLDHVVARTGLSLAVVEQAAAACTQLALVLREDRSAYADSTMARALALLALCRAGGRRGLAREQCALAWAMGYTEEAAALAPTLAGDDAIRLLTERSDAALHEAARRPDALQETRICDLLARARAADFDGWRKALRAAGRGGGSRSFAPLATALAFRRFDVASVVGPVLIDASFQDVLDAPPRPRADSTTLAAFERLIARPEVSRRGQLAGGAVPAARRALFYSGLFAWNEFVLDRLGSPQQMKRDTHALPSGQGTSWSWYTRWQRHLSQDANGVDVGLALRTDVADPDVPAPFALASYDALMERMPVRDGVPARSATRTLAARLDTRPRFALELALACQDHVRWPTLTERLLVHAEQRAGNEMPRARILLAMMRDDRSQLGRMVTDAALDPRVAMAALRTYLGSDSSAGASLLHWFDVVAARDPREWDLAGAHAALLEARGRFAEAERVVWEWTLQADSTQDALDSTVAVTALARLQRKQGKIREALATIGDLDLGQQRGAMEEKARLLALTGDLPGALAVARRSHERYPQEPGTHVFPAELHWLAGRNEEAAGVVAKITSEHWTFKAEVAESFADVFGGHRDRVEPALEAIRRSVSSYPLLLHWIVRELHGAGHRELAARLAEHAHPGSGSERGFGIANTYQLIASARGGDAARAWLARQSMDAPARALASGFLTVGGHAGEAWELERAFAGDDYDWVMRAAAWRMDGGRRERWADTLRMHAPAASDGLYPRLTRYLLDEEPEAEILALADSPKHRAEVWYHCGLMAWSQGRARDALLWMVLCLETGSVRDGEYIWARSALADWCAAWRVPEKLGIGVRGV